MDYHKYDTTTILAFSFILLACLGGTAGCNSSESDEPFSGADSLAVSQPLDVATPDSELGISPKVSSEDSLAQNQEEAVASGQSLTRILILALAASVLALAASIWTTWRVYRWRMRLPTDQMSVVPEELLQSIDRQHQSSQQSSKALQQLATHIGMHLEKVGKRQEELLESFLTLHEQLARKDRELVKLESGYEEFITKKLLSRLIRVDQMIAEELEDSEGSDSINRRTLSDLRDLSEDALDEAGVEIFAPTAGTDYRDEFGVADNPKESAPPSRDQEHQIVETIEPGYRLRIASGYYCLRPAKVHAYGVFKED